MAQGKITAKQEEILEYIKMNGEITRGDAEELLEPAHLLP